MNISIYVVYSHLLGIAFHNGSGLVGTVEQHILNATQISFHIILLGLLSCHTTKGKHLARCVSDPHNGGKFREYSSISPVSPICLISREALMQKNQTTKHVLKEPVLETYK